MDYFRMFFLKDSIDLNEFNVILIGIVIVLFDVGDYVEIYVYIGYNGIVICYVKDVDGWKNYFDILEIGGKNYLIV